MKNKSYYLVDENGEVVQEMGTDLVRIMNNDILIRSSVPFRKTTKIDYKFAKVNYNAMLELYKECPLGLLLIPHINYKTNSLRYTNGVYINQTNFAKEVGVTRQTISRVFKKLEEMQVIISIKAERRNVYILNPYIAVKGNEIYTDILDRFQNTKWKELAERKGKRNEF